MWLVVTNCRARGHQFRLASTPSHYALCLRVNRAGNSDHSYCTTTCFKTGLLPTRSNQL